MSNTQNTQQKTQEQKPQLTATQRIGNLENAMMSIYNALDQMARDMGLVKDAIKLLGNKLETVAKLLENGESVNDTSIAAGMTARNVLELKEKISNLEKQGVLVSTDQVSENSFVAGQELNEAGQTVNPRLQFAASALVPEVKAKMIGAKVGDIIPTNNNLSFQVQEIYEIQKMNTVADGSQAQEATQEQAKSAESQETAAEATQSTEQQ